LLIPVCRVSSQKLTILYEAGGLQPVGKVQQLHPSSIFNDAHLCAAGSESLSVEGIHLIAQKFSATVIQGLLYGL
jgi:hypothetical protein